MKFLVDAQLPPSLASFLNENGYDAVHTLSLPKKNMTDDEAIIKISMKEKRIVITKDIDFYHSFLIRNKPFKLLFIRVGNMRRKELTELVSRNLGKIIIALRKNKMVELRKHTVYVLY